MAPGLLDPNHMNRLVFLVMFGLLNLVSSPVWAGPFSWIMQIEVGVDDLDGPARSELVRLLGHPLPYRVKELVVLNPTAIGTQKDARAQIRGYLKDLGLTLGMNDSQIESFENEGSFVSESLRKFDFTTDGVVQSSSHALSFDPAGPLDFEAEMKLRISNRLQHALSASGQTITSLAGALGLSYQKVWKVIHKQQNLTLWHLLQTSIFLGVTPQWFLGAEAAGAPSWHPTRLPVSDWQSAVQYRMNRAVERSGQKKYLIARQVGLTPSALTRILNGENGLTIGNLQLFADLLEVDLNWLSGFDLLATEIHPCDAALTRFGAGLKSLKFNDDGRP
jgi:transcriptional regulator with XRE-family HTH domain